MYRFSVVDLLQSSGPIALNELVMRMPEGPQEAVSTLKRLQNEGRISISGPLSDKIQALKIDPETIAEAAGAKILADNEILGASDTFVELSASSWRRSFAS